MRSRFPGRLGLQQRVLPNYRVPFFDALAAACEGGLGLFAGDARAKEYIAGGEPRAANLTHAGNIHLFPGKTYLCWQRGLLDWLSDWNPDALIVEANPRYPLTPIAVRWMHRCGRPVLGWGLGAPPLSGLLARFRQKRWVRFLSQFDGLIAYSRRGADEYAALGFPRERIFVAHNAVSPAPEIAPPARPAAFKNHPTLLFVGRLQARKRIDLLLRACAALGETRPHLIVVGDGPEREKLENLAEQVYPSARFVGARYGEELNSYFAETDLFVLPGTGGLAVQQAMSHGLPVIVARGDGTQDDLVRPENGWQVPPGDYEALVGTIREALSDASRLRKMGEESFRIVSQEINLEKMVEVFVGALNSLR